MTKTKRAPRKGEGRPSIFTKELSDLICKRIAQGESVRSICKEEKMPNADTIYAWLLEDDKKEFSDKYARARNIQAELMFEELLEIADDGTNDWMTLTRRDGSEISVEDREVVNRSKLRVDTRKWYLSKVLPKKYGEKVDVTSDGKAIKGNMIVLSNFKDETNS